MQTFFSRRPDVAALCKLRLVSCDLHATCLDGLACCSCLSRMLLARGIASVSIARARAAGTQSVVHLVISNKRLLSCLQINTHPRPPQARSVLRQAELCSALAASPRRPVVVHLFSGAGFLATCWLLLAAWMSARVTPQVRRRGKELKVCCYVYNCMVLWIWPCVRCWEL